MYEIGGSPVLICIRYSSIFILLTLRKNINPMWPSPDITRDFWAWHQPQPSISIVPKRNSVVGDCRKASSNIHGPWLGPRMPCRFCGVQKFATVLFFLTPSGCTIDSKGHGWKKHRSCWLWLEEGRSYGWSLSPFILWIIESVSWPIPTSL